MSAPGVSISPPRFFLPILSALIALAPFAIDVYLPSFPAIAEYFSVEPIKVNFTMSAYLIGFAIGQIFGGPLSDQLGRKRIGILGLSVFIVLTVSILFVNTLIQLIVLRVLQAVGGGLLASVVMPTVRDVSSPEQTASRSATVYLIMMLAPLIAPIIGISILPLGWKWIFVFLAVYALIMFVIYVLSIPETREATRGLPDFKAIYSQYRQAVAHRVEGKQYPIRYGVATALSGGIMLIYLTNASFIFQTYYQVEMHWFPFYFGANVLGVAMVQSFSARYLARRTLPQIAEYLRFGHILQLLTFVALAVLTAVTEPPIWVFLPVLVLGVACGGIINPSGMGVYLSSYRKLSGSAAAVLSTSTFVGGSIIGFIAGMIPSASLLPASIAMLTASLLANLLILSINKNAENRILEKIRSGEIKPI